MPRYSFPAASAALILGLNGAWAASVDIDITDTRGHPAADAVVSLVARSATAPPSQLPTEGIIDQRNETFIPLVTLLRKGGRVVFTNHDSTMHQVYSFSPIKQFEFEMAEGHRSEPVVFDKPGVASIGCNIHDRMITYVFVADTPWAILTDSKGHARIPDIPLGSYRVDVWHPQLVPGRPSPSASLNVTEATRFALAIALLPPPPKQMHMGTY
jgi:plastocyanin